MTAPAACAACNDHESCLSTALDASAAAIQAPGFRKPMISLDDTFSKAQTDRRTTQLLAPGERSSPSQLDQPSRRGCGAVPSRWASRVLPASVRCEEQARGTAESKRSPVYQKISLHTGPLAPLLSPKLVPPRRISVKPRRKPLRPALQVIRCPPPAGRSLRRPGLAWPGRGSAALP